MIFAVCGFLFFIINCECVTSGLFIKQDSFDGSSYLLHKSEVVNETIRLKVGSNATLKCKMQSCGLRKIRWQFTSCKPDKIVPCYNQIGFSKKMYLKENASWKRARSSRRRHCNLHIKNVTEEDNGIYDCYENNHFIKRIELQIVGMFKNIKQSNLKILDVDPSELIVPQSRQAVIKCAVYSQKEVPLIIWLKEVDEKTEYSVTYNEKHYKVFNQGVYPMPRKADVYLSKLNIDHVTTLDGGSYVCYAISSATDAFKSVNIKVEEFSYAEEVSDKSYFPFLLLVPLPFILIPITIYYCCYKRRKLVPSNKQYHHQSYLAQPTLENGVIKAFL